MKILVYLCSVNRQIVRISPHALLLLNAYTFCILGLLVSWLCSYPKIFQMLCFTYFTLKKQVWYDNNQPTLLIIPKPRRKQTNKQKNQPLLKETRKEKEQRTKREDHFMGENFI